MVVELFSVDVVEPVAVRLNAALVVALSSALVEEAGSNSTTTAMLPVEAVAVDVGLASEIGTSRSALVRLRFSPRIPGSFLRRLISTVWPSSTSTLVMERTLTTTDSSTTTTALLTSSPVPQPLSGSSTLSSAPHTTFPLLWTLLSRSSQTGTRPLFSPPTTFSLCSCVLLDPYTLGT